MAREDLTPVERMLYDDSYTSSTTVYDEHCYICRDPDYAQMGLPLCKPCPACSEKAGKDAGHIAADDSECSICGFDYTDEL